MDKVYGWTAVQWAYAHAYYAFNDDAYRDKDVFMMAGLVRGTWEKDNPGFAPHNEDRDALVSYARRETKTFVVELFTKYKESHGQN